jgi:hypothetical protein
VVNDLKNVNKMAKELASVQVLPFQVDSVTAAASI